MRSAHLHPPPISKPSSSSSSHPPPASSPSPPPPLTPSLSSSPSHSSPVEIAIFGRSADPFFKENWSEDFDLDAEPPSPSPLPTPKAAPSHSPADEDWDADLPLDPRPRRSTPSSLPPPRPHPLPVPSPPDADDEDWDREIEAEEEAAAPPRPLKSARHSDHHALRSPTTPKRAQAKVSWKGDEGARAAEGGLKVMLQRMLVQGEGEGEEGEEEGGVAGGLPQSQSLLPLLLASSSEARVNIVTYPPPSSLYSLRTDDGRAELSEKALEQWLRDIVSKHDAQRIKATRHPARFDERLLNPSPPPSAKGSISGAAGSATAYGVGGGGEGMLSLLTDCLLHLNLLHHEPHPPPTASEDAWSLITRLFAFLSSSSSSPSSPLNALLDSPSLYAVLYPTLFLASKYWTPGRSKAFFTFTQTAQALLPSHAGMLELLEVECVAHHDGSRANKLLRIFTSLYLKHSATSPPTPRSHLCTAQALTDLNFYITNSSPLTTTLLSPDALWDAADEQFAWMDRAWTGEAPAPLPTEDERRLEAELYRLCGHPSYRIELLRAIYPHLPVGWVKARAAYSLGHYALVHAEEGGDGDASGHTREAERFLMEAVFILDHIPPLHSASPDLAHLPLLPVLSSLSSTALVLYADTLLSLSKYPYAIHAYEAAALSWVQRTHTPHHALVKRLCDICTSHEDLPRSALYHAKILDKAKQDGNLNMLVYIVQELSRLEVVQGHLKKSEEHLRHALSFLRPYASANPPQDGGRFSLVPQSEFKSATLNLFLQLARLYLDSDRTVNACVVLETLVRSESLPRSKAGVVNLLLATAYLRRRRYKKAEKILKTMEQGQTSGTSGGAGKKSTMSTGGLSIAGGDILNSLDYLLTRTQVYYHSGDFTNALYWIDLSLSVCSTSSLSMLARLHYRKGKIYQAALYASMRVQEVSDTHFPPPLSPPFVLGGLVMPDPRKAIQSLYDAYHFYETIDDRVHMTKCLTRITDLYLHIVFVPIALFAHPPSAIAPWLSLAEFAGAEPWRGFLSSVEELARDTLAASLATLQWMGVVASYLSLAEIRLMQGDVRACEEYWQAAKDAVWALWVSDGFCVAGRKGSPGWVAKVGGILRRLVRLMMARGGGRGGGRWMRRRLEVVEVWALHDMDAALALKRADDEDDDVDPAEAEPKAAVRGAAAGRNDLAMLDVFAHHSFEPLSPSSPTHDKSGATSVKQRGTQAQATSHTWSEHRSMAFGALGSRSKHSPSTVVGGSAGTGSALGLSLCSLSPAALSSVHALSERVLAGQYELGRARDQHSAGKLPAKELYDRNHATLNRMRAAMATMRTVMEGKGGGGGGGGRLSLWLASGCTLSDPLWPQLVYVFALDQVWFVYAPRLSHRMVRLMTTATPSSSPVSASRGSSTGSSTSFFQAGDRPGMAGASQLDALLKEFYATAPAASPSAAALPPTVEVNLRTLEADDGPPTAESPAVAAGDVCDTCGCQWYVHHPQRDECRNCFHRHGEEAKEPSTQPHPSADSSDDEDAAPAIVSPPPPFRDVTAEHKQVDASADVSLEDIRLDAFAPPVKASSLDGLLPPALDVAAFAELFSSLDPQNILTLFSALFSECQVVVTSASLWRLSSVMTSLTRLMYPFAWQHTFIPLLAPSSLPLLTVHLPYLVGVHTALFDPSTLPSSAPSAVPSPFAPVVADLDRNLVRYAPGAFINFPVKCKQRLYKAIVRYQSSMFLLQAGDRGTAAAAVKGGGRGAISTTMGVSSGRSLSVYGVASGSEGEAGPSKAPPSPSLAADEVGEGKEEGVELKGRRSGEAVSAGKAYPALRALRDAFIRIFLSLFSTYPLFLTPPAEAKTAAAAAFPFDLPSFLFHSKAHYASFLHSMTRTRLFRHFIALRASPHMHAHRLHLRRALYAGCDSNQVHWKELLHHTSTSSSAPPPTSQPPTSSPSSSPDPSSPTSPASATPSSASSSSYLFDDLCLRKLHAKRLKAAERERCDFEESVLIARAGGPHKRRFLVLRAERLSIYGSKRIKEKKGGGEVKYERRVDRWSGARVAVGGVEGDGGKVGWEVIGGVEVDGAGKEKGEGSWHVKSESEDSKKRWVKLLQARCMTDEMRRTWEAVA